MAEHEDAQLADLLLRFDLFTLDELGYLPFGSSGGALLFNLLGKLHQRNSVVISTNMRFIKRAGVFGDARMTMALLERLTLHCYILEIRNESSRFRSSATEAWNIRVHPGSSGFLT